MVHSIICILFHTYRHKKYNNDTCLLNSFTSFRFTFSKHIFDPNETSESINISLGPLNVYQKCMKITLIIGANMELNEIRFMKFMIRFSSDSDALDVNNGKYGKCVKRIPYICIEID